MTSPSTRTEIATVKEVAPVDGNKGPQWKIQMEVSWSQYPIPFWLDQAVVDEPQAESKDKGHSGKYKCTFGRGALMPPGKNGIPKDPAQDYSYKWYINAWDVDADVPVDMPSYTPAAHTNNTPQTPATPAAPGLDPTRTSIERQVAFKGAIELVTSRFIEPSEVGQWTDYFYGCIAGTHVVTEEVTDAEIEELLEL